MLLLVLIGAGFGKPTPDEYGELKQLAKEGNGNDAGSRV
jgi:hypothetical protein